MWCGNAVLQGKLPTRWSGFHCNTNLCDYLSFLESSWGFWTKHSSKVTQTQKGTNNAITCTVHWLKNLIFIVQMTKNEWVLCASYKSYKVNNMIHLHMPVKVLALAKFGIFGWNLKKSEKRVMLEIFWRDTM